MQGCTITLQSIGPPYEMHRSGNENFLSFFTLLVLLSLEKKVYYMKSRLKMKRIKKIYKKILCLTHFINLTYESF